MIGPDLLAKLRVLRPRAGRYPVNPSRIEEIIAGLEANGVAFEDYGGMTNHIMENGPSKLAWLRDPDGNTIALDQYTA